LKNTVGVNPGGDTGAQITNSAGRIVDISKGTGPNESNLRPGDLLFYKRSSSKKTKGVGHVEMYMGQGQRAGHGGGKNSPYGLDSNGKGKGPFVTPINSDAANYIEAKRFTTPSGSGSGLIKYDFTQPRANTTSPTRDITRTATQQVIRNLDYGMAKYGGNSGVGNSDMTQLLQIAVEYMKTIAQNTSHNTNIKAIVDILTSMMQIMGTSSSVPSGSNVSEQAQTAAEQETKNIMAKLKQLASAV
jgi:hypothetical protein